MNSETIQSETQKNQLSVTKILEESETNATVTKINDDFQQGIQGKSETEIRRILERLITSDKTRGEFDKYYNKLRETLTAGEIMLALWSAHDVPKNALYYWLLFRSQQEMQKNKLDQDKRYNLADILRKFFIKLRQR